MPRFQKRDGESLDLRVSFFRLICLASWALKRQRFEFPQPADDILIPDTMPFLQVREPGAALPVMMPALQVPALPMP